MTQEQEKMISVLEREGYRCNIKQEGEHGKDFYIISLSPSDEKPSYNTLHRLEEINERIEVFETERWEQSGVRPLEYYSIWVNKDE